MKTDGTTEGSNRIYEASDSPSFYLNCLNLAYNMVELEKYDECRQMLRLTSNISVIC